MVYKRFVKRGKKVFGPYYYESYRVGDKVKKRYLIRGENVEQQNQQDRKFKLSSLWIILPLILAVLSLFLIPNLIQTGNVAFDIPTVFKPNETITGNLKIILKAGELLPATTEIIAFLGSQEKRIPISDAVIDSTVNGSFYVENKEIVGSGPGYGVIGDKKIYPEITFSFRIIEQGYESWEQEQEQKKNKSRENITISNETLSNETISNETISNETISNETLSNETLSNQTSGGNIANETISNETAKENKNNNENKNNQTESGSNNEKIKEDKTKTEKTQTGEEKNKEVKASETSSSGNNENNGNSGNNGESVSLTGNAIFGEVIEGSVSYGKPFIYNLEKGQKAELVPGSVKINGQEVGYKIDLSNEEDNKLIVETNYYEIEQGFGRSYNDSEKTKTLSLNLQVLDLKAEPGEMTIELVYDNQELVSEKTPINVEGANETVLSNETIANITTENLTLIKNLGEIRIQKNFNLSLDLDNYFAKSENYSVDQIEDISLIVENNHLSVIPDKNFVGTRESRIVASQDIISELTNEDNSSKNITTHLEIAENFNISVYEPGNATIRTKQFKGVIGQPVKWVKVINVENNTKNLSIEIPKEAENITIKTGIEAENALSEAVNSEVSRITGNVVITIEIKKPGPLTRAWSWVVKHFVSTGNVIDESVLNDSIVESGDNKIVDLSSINETQISVEYYTQAPVAVEENITNGKKIVVSAPDQLNYTDILAYSELDNSVKLNSGLISLIWQANYEDAVGYGYINSSENESENTNENLTYNIPVNFDEYDLDGDGNVDYIEWVVPHLSSQTYVISVMTGTLGNIVQENNFTHLALSDSSIVLYMPFDDNVSSTKTYDYSSNNNDGDLKSGAYPTASGVYGNGMFMDGVDDNINVTDSSSLEPGNITISLWVNPRSFSAATAITLIGKRTTTGNGYLFFYLTSTNTLNFDWNGPAQNRWNTGYLPPLNTFTHLVITRNDTERDLYVNGVYQSSTTVVGDSSLIATTADLHIGDDSISDRYFFNGTLDDVMIYNRALNKTDISNMYKNQSARFASSGTQDFNNVNISSDGSENSVNMTLFNCQTLKNSGLSLQVGTVSGTGYSYGTSMNFVNCFASANFTGNPNNLSLRLNYSPDSYQFYSPIVIWNATAISNTLPDTTAPSINFTSNTTINGTSQSNTDINVQVLSTDSNNISSFIDFDNSLVSWWRFENNSNDYTGRNNGTNSGTIINVTGRIGNAYNFSSAAINMGNVINFERLDNFTISAWVNAPSSSSIRYFVSKGLGSTTWNGYGLGIQPTTNTIRFALVKNYVSATSGNYFLVSGTQSLVGGWHLVSVVYNGTGNASGVQLYYDGVKETKSIVFDNLTTDLSNSNNFHIGDYGGALPYTGSLDDVIIFNRSLSASEIAALYANFSSRYYSNNFTSLSAGNHTFKAYSQDTSGNVGTTETRSVTITTAGDTIYPIFSNYWDDSGVFVDSAIANFNVSINNTNGTVFLQINNTNYTAVNVSGNVYNMSVNFTNSGTYSYFWISFGNGTSKLMNVSETRSYAVNSTGDTIAPSINFTSNTTINGTSQTNTDINVQVLSSDSASSISSFIDFDNSLLGWWRFDNRNSSGGVVDYIGKNNGSLSGALINSSSGYFGNGSWFDGSNDYIILSNNQLNTTKDITISVWVKPAFSGGGLYYRLVDKDRTSAYSLALFSGVNPTLAAVYGGSQQFSNVISSGAVSLNQWSLVTVVYNGTGIAYYINGTYVDSKIPSPSGNLGTNTANLYLGSQQGVAAYFNGSMDDVMIFNRTLTATEIAAIYANTNSKFYSNNFTNLMAGTHTFTAYAQDTAANINFTETRTVTINDTTIPNINFTSKTTLNGASQTNTDINVEVNASDSQSSISSFIDFDNSLISWYRFEGNVNDYFGRNNGTWVTTTGITNVTAIFANGFNLRGNRYDGFINTSRNAVLDMPKFSFSIWINSTADYDWAGYPTSFLEYTSGATSINGWSLRDQGTSPLGYFFKVYNQTSSNVAYFTGTTYKGKWTHIVGTYDNSTGNISIYANGVFMQSAILSGGINFTGNERLRIGGNINTDGNMMHGSIDDLMIFNRTLSATEVAGLYANTNSKYYSRNFTNLMAGTHTFTGYAQDLAGNVNNTETRQVTIIGDTTYPIFSTYWDNNGTLTNTGTGLFNVTITNTNGTVFLEISGANVSARNISSLYNASKSFTTNGTYAYKWIAYGNGTSKNLNVSETKYFSVNFSSNLSDCATLNVPNTIYNLKNNIYTTTTCFTINANNVTLNLNGFNLSSSTLNSNYIVSSSYSNVSIINGSIINSSNAILASGSDDIIRNMKIFASGYAIVSGGANDNFQDIYINSSQIYNPYSSTLTNITIENAIDDVIYNPDSCNFYNITISGNDSSANGLIASSYKSKYLGFNISTEGGYAFGSYPYATEDYLQDGYLASNDANGGPIIVSEGDAILLNVTYIGAGQESVFAFDNPGRLIRKWYVDVNVSNSTSSLQNANVSAWNITSDLQFSKLSGADGYIVKQNLTEYINYEASWGAGATKTYVTPHTINTTLSGYDTNSTQINLTATGNTLLNVRLSLSSVADSTYPQFSTYWDNNGTLSNTGTGLFNVTLTGTNTTTFLEINNTNITAGFSGSMYNASYIFTNNGTYSYKWISFGNGTSHLMNVSETKYYSVNTIVLDTTPPNINFSLSTIANNTSQTNTDIFVGVNSTDSASNISVFTDFDNSLLGWWRFENNSNDYFGKYNGTLSGTLTNTSGKMGNAYQFDGVASSYINVSAFSSLSTQYSMSFWIKTSTTSGIPISWGGATGNARFCRIGGVSANKINCPVDTTSAGSATSTSDVNDGVWHNIVITSTANSQILYFDGNSQGSASETLDITSYILRFGNINQDTLGYPFNGSIDDVMIFNRTLSATEIAGIYANSSSKYVTNNFTGLGVGTHTFTGYAQDLAGNVNTTELRTVTINSPADTTPPNINFSLSTIANNTSQTNTDIFVGVNSTDSASNISVFSDFDNSLVSWWRAEGNANDYMGRNNGNLTNHANATAAGMFNSSFGLDGVDDYVSLGTPTNLMFNENQSFTVSGWANPRSTSGYGRIFAADKGAGVGGYRLLIDTPTGKWYFQVYNGTGSPEAVLYSSSAATLNQWSYVVGVFNKTNIFLYVNGNLVNSSSWTGTISYTDVTGLGIGARPTGTTNYFNGSLDDIMIFNRSLSASEISGLYADQTSKYVTNNFTSLSVGTHTFKGYAQDTAGNINTTEMRSVTITTPADTTPPNINFSLSTIANNTSQTNTDIFVGVNSTDATSNISVFTDFDNSLVSWWRFENNSNDYLGRNNGTLSGAVTNITGKLGNAYNFDGVSSYINVTNPGSVFDGTNLTISAWINAPNFPNSYPRIIDRVYNGQFCFYIYGAGPYLGGALNTTGTSVDTGTLSPSGCSISTNTWTYVSMIYDGETIYFYKNGVQCGTETRPSGVLANSTSIMRIGERVDGTLNRNFNGSIDDLIILNRSLSASEILGLYANTTSKYVTNNFTSLSVGTHTFKGYAQDTAGNINTTEIRTVTITTPADTTPPNINFSLSTIANNTSQTNTDIFVGVNSTDSASNISVFTDFDNSLVSWWRMDDRNSSGGVVDYMGKNNGSLINHAAINSSSGYFGNGSYFDGVDDYVNVGKMGSFGSQRDKNFSISFWINPRPSGVRNTIIGTADDAGGGNTFNIKYNSNSANSYSAGSLRIATCNNTISPITCNVAGTNANTIPTDVWTNVVVQFYTGNGSTNVYINGVGQTIVNNSAGPVQGAANFANDVYIGALNLVGTGSQYFNGSIDDVMIFNRTLSSAEVAGLYANTTSKYVTNNFTSLSVGTHTFKGYSQDTAGNLNFTELRTVTINDATYPLFSTYWDNNGSLAVSGTANFNVTITNTNGTVFLNINGTSIMASNIAGNVYNASFFLINGTYMYNWSAYGNGTSKLLNYSENRYYTLNNTALVVCSANMNLTACGVLSCENTTYTLLNNVNSSGSCFAINATNITLNGNGKLINYSQSIGSFQYNAVYVTSNFATIKNARIVEGNPSGSGERAIYVYSTANNAIIQNNTITTYGVSSYGIDLYSTSNNNIINNNITTQGGDASCINFYSVSYNNFTNNICMATGNSGEGISAFYIYWGSSYNTFINNTITTSGDEAAAFYLGTGSGSNTFINNTITTTGIGSSGFSADTNSNSITGGTINSTQAERIYLTGSSNNIFRDIKLIGTTLNDSYLWGSSINNSFLNVSYSTEYVESGSQLIRQWYVDVNVSNSTNSLQNANVTIANVTGTNIYSELTNSNGLITTQAVTEYINTGGTKTYATPHTINTTLSGYDMNSTTINLTLTNNTWLNVRLYLPFVSACPNNMSGNGTPQNPCNITSWVDLNATKSNLTLAYSLITNLSASSSGYSGLGDIWQPIGNSSNNFSGTFNGNGNSISNLSINLPSTNGVGLFGWVYGNISNLNLYADNISGKYYVAGLVGLQYSGLITNSSATISGNVSAANSYAGGLVGYQNSGTITSSYSTISGNVSAVSSDAGGLVGYSMWPGNISNSYSTITGSVFTISDAGGLVGNSQSLVTNSYSTITGSVFASSQNAGGLAGISSETITNSSATITGNISGGSNVGGLVGSSSATITNSSATITGNISGSSSVGGFIGYQNGDTISNSYSTITGSVFASSPNVGGLVGYQYDGTITSSYSTISGTISSTNYTGGLVGYQRFAGTISNSSVIVYDSANLSANSSYIGLFAGFQYTFGINPIGTITSSFGTISNSQFGNITFLSWNVTKADGGNLTSFMYLRNNSAYVNSSASSGFNVSANITLTGLKTDYTNPVIYKDGNIVCNSTTVPACFNFTSLNAGTVRFNVTSWSSYSIGEVLIDTTYPQFSTYWDNNGTLSDSGTANFNVTITNTNGTAFLEINNTNITASNLTSAYNASIFLTNGTYSYKWIAYGNGTSHLMNVSENRYYTLNNTALVVCSANMNLTACGVLSCENTTYTLLNNVNSSGTCFTINATNITLNGAGKLINYSQNGGSSNYGVYSTYNLTTVKNVRIIQGSTGTSDNAVYFNYVNNGTILNNTITTSGSSSLGVVLDFSSSNNITSNIISGTGSLGSSITFRGSGNSNIITGNNLTVSGGVFMFPSSAIFLNSYSQNFMISSNTINILNSDAYGIFSYNSISNNFSINSNNITSIGFGISLRAVSNSTVNNNIITSASSGILFSLSLNNILTNNSISTNGTNGYGIYISGESSNNSIIGGSINSTNAERIYISTGEFGGQNNNNIFKDMILIGTTKNDTYLDTTSVNNTFLNVTYSAEYVDSGSQLIRQWYVDVNVSNSTSSLQNANVSGFNLTGQQIFSQLTSATGGITTQAVTEYVNNGTVLYMTPHTINTTLSGYVMNSTQINLTQTNNTLLNVRLQITISVYPVINFSSETFLNGTIYKLDNIVANVTANASNILNITINLYNSTRDLVRVNSTSSSPFYWNITALTDGTYYLNATINDSNGNMNFTETRTVTLDMSWNMTLNKGWNLVSLVLKNVTTGEKNISLAAGWNLIGFSGNESSTVDSLNVSFSPAKSWNQGVADNNISAYFGYYDSSQSEKKDRKYKYAAASELGMDDDSLRAGKGYWVYSNASGTLSMQTSGSPSGQIVNYTALRLSNGTDERSATAAAALGWISGIFYYWDSSTNQFKTIRATGGSRNYIDSWNGVMVYSIRDNITIIRKN